MIEHTTAFIKPPVSRADTGFGLPSDLLEKARRRVRIVGFLVLFAAGADLVIMLADLALGGARLARLGDALPFFANLVSVAAALVMVAAASSKRVRDQRLLELALLFEVFICLVISVSSPLSFHDQHGALPNLTWVTPLVILFPLIVPCPPGRTLVTALAAAATCPAGLFILAAAGRIRVGPDDYFSASFGPALAVVFAYFGSRVIYGLGIEVARARRLGSYELVRRLGEGGMGEVWLAKHRLLARPAAVKLVRPELLGATGVERDLVLQRFEREAQATASMRSPHTIGLYDFGVADDGTFYYVMELLDGFDADSLVRRFGPVPPERAIHLLRQVCHSLAEAHEAGLIHRDIKPANVHVCRYGLDADFVKVLDFGLVRKFEDADAGLTADHVITGTPAFMAPELVMGHDRGDARSDLYAVGCLAYWLLTGRLLFEGTTLMEVLTHHARTTPEPPSRRTEQPIPDALEQLVLSCLEKDPARRPQSARALSERLAACTETPWSQASALEWWSAHSPASGTGP